MMLAGELSGHVVLVIAAMCLLMWLGLLARSSRGNAAADEVPPTLVADDDILPGAPSSRTITSEPPVWERYAALAGPARPRYRATYQPRDRRAAAFAAAVGGQGRYTASAANAGTAPPDPPAPVDYYALFGVGRDTSAQQIEVAYREYVRSIHPDRFFGDSRKHAWAQAKLREANVAIAVLRDPVRRTKYNASL